MIYLEKIIDDLKYLYDNSVDKKESIEILNETIKALTLVREELE